MFASFAAKTDDTAMTVDDVRFDRAGRMAVMGFARRIAVYELPLVLMQAAGAP